MRAFPTFRCVYLLLNDLWLYGYADRNYTGLISTIFETITDIQLLKFEYLEKYLGLNRFKAWLRISDYREYSVPRFVEVEGASSVFLDSNFAFFVYAIPQNTLFCLGILFVFHCVQKYSVSRYIRKFYFIKSALAIALLE